MTDTHYYAKQELRDEDWKTQLARKYPNIPQGAEVHMISDAYNCYGHFCLVEYHGNRYYVKPTDIETKEN